jgi:hypothetical protein
MLWEEANIRFKNRTSGYTKMIRLGQRSGDNAEEVLLVFVDERVIIQKEITKNVQDENKGRKKRADVSKVKKKS